MKLLGELGAFDLLLAKSPDERSLAMLRKALSCGPNVRKVGTIEYAEYTERLDPAASGYDKEAYEEYWRMYKKCDELIKRAGVPHQKLVMPFDAVRGIDDGIGRFFELRADCLVVDISCVPRMHLVALIWLLLTTERRERKVIVFAYTRAAKHLPEEERFSVGVKGFAAIPGLSGKIRHQDSVCVIAAGFEGNRAYAAFRHLSPLRAHVMLGEPEDSNRDFYRTISRRNNHELLASHRVTNSGCCSLDPVRFACQLRAEVDRLVENYGPCNIYVVPLGTKAQALGSVLVARKHPEIQFLFTLPAHRRISAKGVGETRLSVLSELISQFDRSNISLTASEPRRSSRDG